jgi:peptidoglycan/LPS O-acetylase OafA/YrhL
MTAMAMLLRQSDRTGAVATTVDHAQRAVSMPRRRNHAIDFTKGALVVLMVVYHWLNYFVDVNWDPYRYLRFLTPSFIFITGFIVSSIYPGGHVVDERRVNARLWQRGAKLLVLFTVLNLAVDMGTLARQGYAVFVTGNGRVAFNVLVPIAYFLLVAPFMLMASRRSRFALPLLTLLALAVTCVLSLRGARSVNLELLAIALLGMLIGTISPERLGRIPGRLSLFFCAYLLYLAAITEWNVLFPLQILGVCLSLLLIYRAAVAAGSEGWVSRIVIELGRYSLFGYIVQVALLQVLRRWFRPLGLGGAELLVPFAVALLLTVGSVMLLHSARQRTKIVDRLYCIVFA